MSTVPPLTRTTDNDVHTTIYFGCGGEQELAVDLPVGKGPAKRYLADALGQTVSVHHLAGQVIVGCAFTDGIMIRPWTWTVGEFGIDPEDESCLVVEGDADENVIRITNHRSGDKPSITMSTEGFVGKYAAHAEPAKAADEVSISFV